MAVDCGELHDAILCAVLDDADSTHVKLGKAHFNAQTRTYYMTDGSLQVSPDCKCSDGTYRKDGSTYTVMSAAEFAARSSTPTRITAPAASMQPIGCSMDMASKTVFVLGNFDGDAARLNLALNQSAVLAGKAASHNNTVAYVISGNVAPSVCAARGDAVSQVLYMFEKGITLSGDVVVEPKNVTLLSGHRELGWLRLMAPKHLREVSMPATLDVLLRPSPFVGVKDPHKRPDIQAHDASLTCFPENMDESQLKVAMLLKLVSVTQRTMGAPGLVVGFARRLSGGDDVDGVALSSMISFLLSYCGNIVIGVARLMHGGGLTPEGLGLEPTVEPVINAVLSYANGVMLPYLKSSSLVQRVANQAGAPVWITGMHIADAVGKLPCGFDSSMLAVEWKDGPEGRVEWASALNKEFKHFSRMLEKGTVSEDLFKAYAGLAIDDRDDPLPLRALAESPAETCYGFASPSASPFGTVRRRVLVKEAVDSHQSDLLNVTDQWVNINTAPYAPSTYWGVLTWCGSTKVDIESRPCVTSVERELDQLLLGVSVTLASMVTARTRGGSVKDYGVHNLSGVLGPVVYNAQHHLMRVAAFSHRSVDVSFVALLPEEFVQFSLDYYNYDLESADGAPMLATEGFLVLPDENIIPLGFEQVSEAENESYRLELGTRLWALPNCAGAYDAGVVRAMSESKCTSTSRHVPGFTILHTRQSSDDPFAGLSVGLNEVPGLRARITLDTDLTSHHALFRAVAKFKNLE